MRKDILKKLIIQSMMDSMDDNLQEAPEAGNDMADDDGPDVPNDKPFSDEEDPELFGLKHIGWGRYADKNDADNHVVAKKIDGRLVKVDPNKEQPAAKKKVTPQDIGQMDIPFPKQVKSEPAGKDFSIGDPYNDPTRLSHRGDHPVGDDGEYRKGQGNYSAIEKAPLKSPEEWQDAERNALTAMSDKFGGRDKFKAYLIAKKKQLESSPHNPINSKQSDFDEKSSAGKVMRNLSRVESMLNTIYDEEQADSGQEERDNAVDPYINQKW